MMDAGTQGLLDSLNMNDSSLNNHAVPGVTQEY